MTLLSALGLGMLVYTLIQSPGYYVARGNRVMVGIFGAGVAGHDPGSHRAVRALSGARSPLDQARILVGMAPVVIHYPAGGGSSRSILPRKEERVEVQRIRIHGHEIAYRAAGSGPVVLLIHGMASNSATWDGVIPSLAAQAAILAPDMPGHGDSAAAGGDHSLGALASSLRDVLLSLGHDRATVVGHSLGGGVAMQFAYQFPQACERLVLVSAGGLGRDVALFLRALAFPGLELVIPPAFAPKLHEAGASVVRLLGRIGIRPGPAFEEIWRDYGLLTRKETRTAFFATLRAVVNPAGQRISATNRLYLAAAVPTLIVWGARDSIIPVRHAHEAHAGIPGSRLEIFERAGHFPQHDEPERFSSVLLEFIRSTEPADLTPARIRELLAAAALAESKESLTG